MTWDPDGVESNLAGLLVSVRTVAEAKAALAGGAAVIDIKEPRNGPLGRAPAAIWRAVRAETPPEVPVSVALGELIELDADSLDPVDLAGIAFRKAGPAGLGTSWPARWNELRHQAGFATGWVAVIYADHLLADAPHPDLVIAVALQAEDCSGVLVDTWDKTQASPLVVGPEWQQRIAQVQATGRFIVLAGRLDRAAIERLSTLEPDLFAVRGAACARGDRRHGLIQTSLVAELVETIRDSTTPLTKPSQSIGF